MKIYHFSFYLVLCFCCISLGCHAGSRGGKAYKQDFQYICHKGKKTLYLPYHAAQAHLGHGDTRGKCIEKKFL